MNYKVKDGIYKLDFELSRLEKQLLDDFCDSLEDKEFQYLSIPTTIYRDTLTKQECYKSLYIDDIHALGGSAEQGILEYFQDEYVDEMLIYSKNTCFREEPFYEDLVRTKEFTKIEQYCFTTESKWKERFEFLLNNSIEFLEKYNIAYRILNMTDEDEGYHKLKYDIEIYCKKFGWIESHSCTYFGEEQTSRFNIKGATHTISNTGIASPRILLPFIYK